MDVYWTFQSLISWKVDYSLGIPEEQAAHHAERFDILICLCRVNITVVDSVIIFLGFNVLTVKATHTHTHGIYI